VGITIEQSSITGDQIAFESTIPINSYYTYFKESLNILYRINWFLIKDGGINENLNHTGPD
jgi:hypothetical protein